MKKMKNPLYSVINVLGWNAQRLGCQNKNKVLEKLDVIAARLKKKKRNVTMCKKLGSGAYGCVFKINKNTAMKISEDRSEINTMSIVKKNPTVNIVKVWDVFRCKIANRTYYFIVEELLKTAITTWKDFADFAMYSTGDSWITRHSVKKAKSDPPTELSHLKRTLPSQWKWLEKIGEYFDKHRIKFADIHGRNIMRRGKHHVLIDLGVARAPRQIVDTL